MKVVSRTWHQLFAGLADGLAAILCLGLRNVGHMLGDECAEFAHDLGALTRWRLRPFGKSGFGGGHGGDELVVGRVLHDIAGGTRRDRPASEPIRRMHAEHQHRQAVALLPQLPQQLQVSLTVQPATGSGITETCLEAEVAPLTRPTIRLTTKPCLAEAQAPRQ